MNILQIWQSNNSSIPFKSDALFHLDGTIIDDSGTKYFKDVSGNDRDFLITDYDFDTTWVKGFPYKSIATISAPAADATLIAEDINNFLYDAGGTPNQIPVISLYQDIDYEHKLFSRHKSQLVDGNGIEIYQGRVMDIVLYDTVKADSQLTACQRYFDVVTEAVSNVRWCTKAGYDLTGDGTKATPWLTLQKVDNSSTNGDLAYIKTGLYDETSYLTNNKLIEFRGIGLNTITSSGTTWIVLTQTDGAVKFSRLIFDGETNTTTLLYLYKNNHLIDKCLIKNAATNVMQIGAVSSNCAITNTLFNGQKAIEIYKNLNLNSCILYQTYLMFEAGSTGLILKNNKIVFDYAAANLLNLFTKDIPVVINGNYINLIHITQLFNHLPASACTNTFEFKYNTVDATSVTGAALMQFNTSFATITIDDNIINATTSTTCLLIDTISSSINNNIVTALVATPINIYNATNIAGNHVVNNNKLIGKYDSGYIVKFGLETTSVIDSTLSSISISNNFIRGNEYYNPANNVTCHGVFVGFQGVATIIKHNWIEGTGMVVLKGSDTDYSNTFVFNNVIKGNQSYGIYVKGVNGVNIFGNTFIENGVSELHFTENTGSDGTENAVVKNNIIINTTGLLVDFLTASCAVGHTFDYNIYYSTVAKPFSVDGVAKTWAEWQGLGYDEHSIFLTAGQFANLFNDYATKDYSLKTGSAAIGVGVNLGASYDDGLSSTTNWGTDTTLQSVTTKQQGTNWDIGAYIY